MPVLEDYLMSQQPVDPVQYSDEARKKALWQGVLQAGLAMMADQGKVYRTKGEAKGSGMASLGKAGMAGLQGYNEALESDLKAQQARELMAMKRMAAGQKSSGEFKTATIKKPGPDGKPHYYSMNPQTGVYDMDQGPVMDETFKRPTTFQAAIVDGESVAIQPNPNTQQMEYWDTKLKNWKILDKPFTLTGQILNPTEASMLGVPYGTTKTEAAGQGMSAVPQAKREVLASFDTAVNILKDVETYSKKVNTFNAGIGGATRLAKGVSNWAGGKTQTAPDVTALMNKTGELSMLIRALGEKGALAEGDVARGLKLIPTEFDTSTVAKQKLNDLRDLFAKNKQTMLISFTTPIGGKSDKSKPDPLGLR